MCVCNSLVTALVSVDITLHRIIVVHLFKSREKEKNCFYINRVYPYKSYMQKQIERDSRG